MGFENILNKVRDVSKLTRSNIPENALLPAIATKSKEKYGLVTRNLFYGKTSSVIQFSSSTNLSRYSNCVINDY